MDRRMISLCLMVLCASPCTAPAGSTSFVVMTESSIYVTRGQTATLPCWLSPQQSAEDLEVRWYRGDRFDTPVMHYQSKKLQGASQEASYFGRVSFGPKDTASDGLATGDVSLKLLNVTTEDTGHYTCYISSNQDYDSEIVRLLVTATGSNPSLSAVWTQDNRVNMSCESEGWYPQPELRWSNQKQDLIPGSLVYRNTSSGLVSVHSWLLVPVSSELSCSVGLTIKDAKVAKVRLESLSQPAKMESESSSGGWVAFAVLLVAALVLAALGAVYYKKKVKNSEPGRDQTDENEKLLPKEVWSPTPLSEASKHYVNIKLEATENPYLMVRGNKVRDTRPDGQHFPDGEMVTCLTAIKGTSGFSSGKHYWEVSLWKENLKPDIKQSWWVGVTSAAKIPHESNLSPNTSNGFWFLSSSPDRADSFQFSTEPKILIPVCSRPMTVGVYLDRDNDELSFYNVDNKSLIGSFAATFKGDIFPLFNPGKGDKVPMEIVQREEQSQTGDEGNYVNVSVQKTESYYHQ